MTAETSASPSPEPTTNPSEPVVDPRELIRALVRQIEMEQQRAIYGHVRLDGMRAMGEATTIPEPRPSIFSSAVQEVAVRAQEMARMASYLWEQAMRWPTDIMERWHLQTSEQAQAEDTQAPIDDLNFPTRVHPVSTYEERNKERAAYYERVLHRGRTPVEIIGDGLGRTWVKYSDGSVSRVSAF